MKVWQMFSNILACPLFSQLLNTRKNPKGSFRSYSYNNMLNKDTVKNNLTTKLQELEEKRIQLTLEVRILEKQAFSKFPATREAAAKALIAKQQELESNGITISEVEKMIKE